MRLRLLVILNEAEGSLTSWWITLAVCVLHASIAQSLAAFGMKVSALLLVVCSLQTLDIDLVHLKHSLHHALRFLSVLVLQHLT
jgi:hypothetical protein